jgi:hypothetical protein
MEFYRLDEVPEGPGERVYRYGWAGNVIGSLALGITGVLCIAFPTYGWLTGQRAAWAAAWLVPSGLCLVWMARVVVRTVGPCLDQRTNWLMRQTPNGLVLKFRSPYNTHLPREDVVAVRIGYGEIAWARKTTEVRVVATSDGSANRVYRHMDLRIASDDMAALADHLRAERAREAPWEKHWWGRTRGKANDYPVQVAADDVIRITWRARPGLNQALASLRHVITVAPPLKVKGDFYALKALSPADQEARVRTLAAEGDVTAAVAAAEVAWGLSTTDAVRRVRDLTGVNDLLPTTVTRSSAA